jgi:hypothetical protein
VSLRLLRGLRPLAMTGRVWAFAMTGWVLAAPLTAQGPPPIMDNSFLIEEAYNQEWGVVQHISLFSRVRGGSWAYAFTQEWPYRGQRHQLSYTVPVLHAGDAGGGSTGPGDVAFNYRLQLVGGESRLWVAPRLSVTLPTGRWQAGRGAGVAGVQVALPMSLEVSPRLAAHLNAGVSLLPRARGANGDRATLTSYAAGASVIFYLSSSINLMLESIAEDVPEIIGPGLTARRTSVFVSPGIRWAHNFRSGLQVVPGLAYARGLGQAGDDSRVLVYLSFEHAFKRRAP